MNRHWQYFKYVVRHKYYVFKAGLKNHTPIYLLVVHDLSKFLPTEWFPYARTFYKANGESQYVETDDFADAWNHHQKFNKHHWQYYLLTWDRGETVCRPMPEKYFREMLADWSGASMAITGKDNTLAWYLDNREKIRLHPKTRFWVERWFHIEDYHTDVMMWLKDSCNE